MSESTGKKAGKVLVWALLALLIVGLAGFGIGSFGGSASRIGTVGDQEITVQGYMRALDQALRAEQAQLGRALTLPEAEARGLLIGVRGQLLRDAALDGETARIGVSVGDARVAEEVRAERAFQGLDGQFDRERYQFALRQIGWTVPDFEEEIRDSLARALLQAGVSGGATAPGPWVETLVSYYGERRSFAWARFDGTMLAEPLPARSEADIERYYAENPDDFTLPRRKKITAAWLSPEAVEDEVAVDDAALADLYEARREEFVIPERRLVERLVFSDMAAAEAARGAIEAGEQTFQGLVEARGLTLDDVDLGEQTRADLGAAAEAVFALEEPGLAGPVETSLGPALFRMNAILLGRETPLEEAREELEAELRQDGARRLLEAMIGDLDDRLAAGATVEELAAETEMALVELEVWSETRGGLADYAGFRQKVAELDEGDFPQIEILEDGGIYAVRLDAVLEPSLEPLEDVRADALQGAERAALIAELTEMAEVARVSVEATGSLEGAGPVDSAELVTRESFVDGTPPALVERAFELGVGETEIVPGDAAVYLLRVDTVEGPDPEDPRMGRLRQLIEAQGGQGIASDLTLLYAQALAVAGRAQFDEAAVNAVHSQVFR